MTVKKLARSVLYIFTILVLLLVLLQMILSFNYAKKIGEYLQKEIQKGTKGEYTLLMNDPKISLWDRSIIFKNVSYSPSETNSGSVKARYIITADDVRINGLGILKFLKSNDLFADVMEFDNLNISIYQSSARFPGKKNDFQNNNFSLYNLIKKKINSLIFNSINIENAKIKIYGNDSSLVFISEENSINVKNFNINSACDHLKRLFLADSFNIKMNTFSYMSGSGLYTVLGHQLTASYSDSILTIDSLELSPNYKKTDFGAFVGYQISRMKIVSSKMSFRKMDVKLFLERNWFISKTLDIDGLVLNVYRDKHLPFKKIIRPSLQQIIRGIPFFVSIDSVKLENSTVTYEELASGSDYSGKISFNRLSCLITGLQNDTSFYSDKSELRLQGNAYFMNRSKLIATYRFPLNSRQESFYCTGILYPMPLEYMNVMLENDSHISITKGQLDSLIFSFYADDKSSNGILKLLYHDLKLELLNKDDKETGVKEKVLSFLARKFVLIDRNPRPDKPVRITKIHFDRNPYRYFFYYTWKSIQSGIIPALGVDPQKKFNR